MDMLLLLLVLIGLIAVVVVVASVVLGGTMVTVAGLACASAGGYLGWAARDEDETVDRTAPIFLLTLGGTLALVGTFTLTLLFLCVWPNL